MLRGGDHINSSTFGYAGWRACGFRDSRFKVVHDYTRYSYYHPRMVGLRARLYCGLFERDGSTSVFGYRHILDRHAGDWANKSAYIQRNWRDLAGWTLMWTLRDPDVVYESTPGRRFCFERTFYLADGGGRVLSTLRTATYLGETGVRVMTHFPTRSTGTSQCARSAARAGGTRLT